MKKHITLKKIVVLLVLTVVLLEGIQVYLSNRIAGTSIEVSRLQAQIKELDEKNISLKSQLLSLSSFESIASRAAEMGFVENKTQDITLKAPIPVALSN